MAVAPRLTPTPMAILVWEVRPVEEESGDWEGLFGVSDERIEVDDGVDGTLGICYIMSGK